MLRELLHKYGLIDDARLDAREGDYKNAFCPHCGAFIPSQYRVLRASDDSMTFDCPDCERSGAVLAVVDVDPLVEPSILDNLDRYQGPTAAEREVDGE